MSVTAIQEEILGLPATERARLIDVLWNSISAPEQTAVLVDLHWLIHQGAVLEFADGRMETAKKPLPKPVKQKPAAAKPTAEGETAAVTETATEVEAASETVVEAPAPTEASAPAVEAPIAAEPSPVDPATSPS